MRFNGKLNALGFFIVVSFFALIFDAVKYDDDEKVRNECFLILPVVIILLLVQTYHDVHNVCAELFAEFLPFLKDFIFV